MDAVQVPLPSIGLLIWPVWVLVSRDTGGAAFLS